MVWSPSWSRPVGPCLTWARGPGIQGWDGGGVQTAFPGLPDTLPGLGSSDDGFPLVLVGGPLNSG